MIEGKEFSKEKKDFNIQFWILLGPAFILTTLFLTSFASINNKDLFLFSIGALVFCQKKRQKGLFYSLLVLAALSLFKHFQIPSGHLWQLGIEFSLSLGFFISYFSFEHINEVIKSYDAQKASQNDALEKLEEELKKEADFHQRQHKNFQYEIDRVNFQLEEKKLEVDSFKNLVENLKTTLNENDRDKEKLFSQIKEKEKQVQLLRETIEEFKEDLQNLKPENDDDLLEDLKRSKSEKEKIEAFSKALAKKLEEETFLRKEKENELEEIRIKNEQDKNKIEELLKAKQSLQTAIEELQEQLHSSSEEKTPSENLLSQKELLSQYENKISELKKTESLYYQLRAQFEDKNKVLSETRKELFHANEKIASYLKAKESLSLEETVLEKDLHDQLGSFEKETAHLEEENKHFQEIITNLTKLLDVSKEMEAPKVAKKRGRKKSPPKETVEEAVAADIKEDSLKYTNFEDLP